jgi:hypothetical protein
LLVLVEVVDDEVTVPDSGLGAVMCGAFLKDIFARVQLRSRLLQVSMLSLVAVIDAGLDTAKLFMLD